MIAWLSVLGQVLVGAVLRLILCCSCGGVDS